MKKTAKILSIILLALITISFATTSVLAAGSATKTNPLDPSTVQDNADYSMADDTLLTTAGKIIGMIRNISVIAAVIIIMVLGVKYMLGSVEEKAEYKKSFMPLIIGIILVVAATSIASFIFGLVD